MVAQVHPFKVLPEKKLPWDGVKAPDPLRDDPSHPHSIIGDDHKNTFHDGGLIEGVGAQGDSFSQALVPSQPAQAPIAAGIVPPLPAPRRPGRRRGRQVQAFADGGKIEDEPVQDMVLVGGHLRRVGGNQDDLVEVVQPPDTKNFGKLVTKARAREMAKEERAREKRAADNERKFQAGKKKAKN